MLFVLKRVAAPLSALADGGVRLGTPISATLRYVTAAYNSLSIDGYRISAELTERVRVGDWNPDAKQ